MTNYQSIQLGELARMYFPNCTPGSATTQLRQWVKLNQQLTERLEELSYIKGQRFLTPLQHEAYIDYLGEPIGAEEEESK
jgi:hypothetical protein